MLEIESGNLGLDVSLWMDRSIKLTLEDMFLKKCLKRDLPTIILTKSNPKIKINFSSINDDNNIKTYIK